jgi:hypothetical protein
MNYQDLLKSLGACEAARYEAGNRDMETVLKTCNRADWLLWLYGRMADNPGWPTRQHVVLGACACAATVLKKVSAKHRPVCRKAISTARKWAAGKVSLDNVRVAAAAADAATAAAADDAAAAAADDDAATAAAAYYAAATAAYYAAAAAADDAAAADAAYYAAAARSKHLKKMCALVHKHCPMPRNRVL